MDIYFDFGSSTLILDARVDFPVLGENESSTLHLHRVVELAKHYEAWALLGLGLGMSRTRWVRIKRAFTRPCYKALEQGIIIYRNRPLFSAQIPFRIRQMWTGAAAGRSNPRDSDLAHETWHPHRADSSVLSTAAVGHEWHSRGLSSHDHMAIGHLPSLSREQSAVWSLDGPMRQRHWPNDPVSDSTSHTAAIPIGSSRGPQSQTLAHRLLEHAFHNSGNTYFQNSMMLCQFWATIVFEDFTPEWWGPWGQHIQRLLMDDSGAMVDLNVDEPFISLHCTWLATHPTGRQQDAAEYAG